MTTTTGLHREPIADGLGARVTGLEHEALVEKVNHGSYSNWNGTDPSN